MHTNARDPRSLDRPAPRKLLVDRRVPTPVDVMLERIVREAKAEANPPNRGPNP